MSTVLIRNLFQKLESHIQPFIEDEREANSIVRLILEGYLQISYADILLNKAVTISTQSEQTVLNALKRVKSGEPIQYVLGYTYFLGKKFSLSRKVLIPRPETEELVDMVIKKHNFSNLKILDVCTGSGCIAISLSLGLKNPTVCGLDIDSDVLAIASLNAEKLGAKTEFFKQDILKVRSLPGHYDIIISNPPYVLEKEKAFIKKNVLDYEPHMALFVPTDDALIFYKKIITLATKYLNPHGKLYFEINEKFGREIRDLLLRDGFNEVIVIKDIHAKERFIEAIL